MFEFITLLNKKYGIIFATILCMSSIFNHVPTLLESIYLYLINTLTSYRKIVIKYLFFQWYVWICHIIGLKHSLTWFISSIYNCFINCVRVQTVYEWSLLILLINRSTMTPVLCFKNLRVEFEFGILNYISVIYIYILVKLNQHIPAPWADFVSIRSSSKHGSSCRRSSLHRIQGSIPTGGIDC